MPSTSLTQELDGVPIISVTNGRIVAWLADVLVDPDTCQVAALVTSTAGPPALGVQAIPIGEVLVWGPDAVLVNRADVIIPGRHLPGSERWLSVAKQLKQCEVVGTDGTRIGELGDVVIDSRGQIVGYDLAQVFVEGPVAYSRQVPARATYALKRDRLVVDMAGIER